MESPGHGKENGKASQRTYARYYGAYGMEEIYTFFRTRKRICRILLAKKGLTCWSTKQRQKGDRPSAAMSNICSSVDRWSPLSAGKFKAKVDSAFKRGGEGKNWCYHSGLDW